MYVGTYAHKTGLISVNFREDNPLGGFGLGAEMCCSRQHNSGLTWSISSFITAESTAFWRISVVNAPDYCIYSHPSLAYQRNGKFVALLVGSMHAHGIVDNPEVTALMRTWAA